MVEMLIFGKQKQEVAALYRYSREFASIYTEEKWEYICILETEQLMQFVEENHLLDMICMDITVEEGISQVLKLREQNKHAYLLLLASPKMSPAVYMRPGIMASSLLLRPLSDAQLNIVLREAFESFSKRYAMPTQETDGQFVIETKTEKQFVDYEQIIFFEAREKKIFLVTQTKEFAFYDTLDQLIEKLPDYFIRCHRSFVVNANKIERIQSGQNLLILKSGDNLPISRSYKKAVKELMQ